LMIDLRGAPGDYQRINQTIFDLRSSPVIYLVGRRR
jgi:hypothetical protein